MDRFLALSVYMCASVCVCVCVCVLSAQHPIKLDPRCFDPAASIQSNCRTTNEEELSNNAPFGKNDTKDSFVRI